MQHLGWYQVAECIKFLLQTAVSLNYSIFNLFSSSGCDPKQLFRYNKIIGPSICRGSVPVNASVSLYLLWMLEHLKYDAWASEIWFPGIWNMTRLRNWCCRSDRRKPLTPESTVRSCKERKLRCIWGSIGCWRPAHLLVALLLYIKQQAGPVV